MKYLSVCSGIEAATVAWHPLGFEPVYFSEIEPFPSAVLAHHYPYVTNLGDMTKFKEWPKHEIDILVGGTPCQSFSVAGLRKGMQDPRGNLALTYLAIANKYRPQWVVWENVPGVLSSNGGRDFGSFLGALAELGYGFAYRVLDAQYFGVPQRRRRVFVVGCLGDWQRAAAVLFERESLRGNPPPSREAGEGIPHDIAPILTSSGRGVERSGDTRGQDPVVATWPAHTAPTLNAAFGSKQGLEDQHALNGGGCSYPPETSLCLNAGAMGRLDAESETLIPTIGGGFDAVAFHNRQDPDISGHVTHPLGARDNGMAVASQERGRAQGRELEIGGDVAYALTAPNGGGRAQERNILAPDMAVRRLTPRECERLQGFPDSYTAIPWRNKPADQCPDGPRYKSLGNSMAVPVMRWIGGRIKQNS